MAVTLHNRRVDRLKLAEAARAERGVLTRAELVELGVSSATITRRVQNKEWEHLLPEVYLLSSSTPDFGQRTSATVKWTGDRPAVFHRETAGYLHGLFATPPRSIHLVAPAASGLRSIGKKIIVARTMLPIESVGSPPRTSLESTVFDLINLAPTQSAALEILIQGVQRRMNIEKLRALMNARRRMRHREFVKRLLWITDEGVESHLELAYLRDVERRHRLPRSIGQKRERLRRLWLRSDRHYEKYRIRVELDGELAHPGRASDADIMRDNSVILELNEMTLRYRWPQIINMPCVVAEQVAVGLRYNGWRGTPTRCSPECGIRGFL